MGYVPPTQLQIDPKTKPLDFLPEETEKAAEITGVCRIKNGEKAQIHHFPLSWVGHLFAPPAILQLHLFS